MTDEIPSKNETSDGFTIGKGQAEYKPEDLQHLSDLEHVRERPSMYIGDTTSRGLHHLVSWMTLEKCAISRYPFLAPLAQDKINILEAGNMALYIVVKRCNRFNGIVCAY